MGGRHFLSVLFNNQACFLRYKLKRGGGKSPLPHGTGVFNAVVHSGDYLYVFGSFGRFRSGLLYFTPAEIVHRSRSLPQV